LPSALWQLNPILAIFRDVTNHHLKMKLIQITLFLLVTAVVHAQPGLDTVKIRPQRLADNVYMLKGSGGNIGLLTGSDGLLMIDDQFAPLSEKISAAIRAIDPGSIRFLINTHLHGDHSGGNENFKKLGATIVAHDMARERMSTEQFSARANRTFPPRDKDAWPVVTFDNKMSFHMNGEDVVLHHFLPGHTDGDAIIKMTKANILHTGDAFNLSGYPYIDGSSGGTFDGYIETLDKIMGLLMISPRSYPATATLVRKQMSRW